MITPDSFVETKYYLKFSAIEGFTDVSGTVESYAVTSTGGIPILPQRNRDFTPKIVSFSFKLYSTTEPLKGMRFKVVRNSVNIFNGIIDDVKYDEKKDEYNLKIAHEFKLLNNYQIRKSELEDELSGISKITEILKILVELILENEIDFSVANTYVPPGGSTNSLASAFLYVKVLFCAGLDYSTSDPEEDETATYWDVFSQLIGVLGCVVSWDGTKYIVKHFTQETNATETDVYKYTNTYIAPKKKYVNCSFSVNFNSDLTKYDTDTRYDLENTLTIGGSTFKNFQISSLVNNLVPIYYPVGGSTSNQIGSFSITSFTNKSEYLSDYNKIVYDTEFSLEDNLAVTKKYDPVKDVMEIEKHEPYTFEIVGYTYTDPTHPSRVNLLGTIVQPARIFVQFTKDLDETAINQVDIYTNVSIPSEAVKITTSKSFVDSKTIRLNLNSLDVGNYEVRVNYFIKAKTQAELFYAGLGYYERNFSIGE